MTPNQADKAVKDAKVAAGVGSMSEKIDKAKRDNKPSKSEQRLGEYGRLCDEGWTSNQISERWGISREGFSAFRSRHGLTAPPADAVVGRIHHHDADRIVSEMVYGLEAYAMSVDLVDVGSIDAEQADKWAISIKQSIKRINGFLKEMTHVQE